VIRGERNRTAIVDALLGLLAEGEGRPSGRAIAERAGVSLRSVFQHFDDMEALYAECVDRQFARFSAYVEPIPASGPIGARIDAIVAQRTRLFEHVAPVRRAAINVAATSPVIQDGLDRTTREMRRQLAATFAPELQGTDRKERLAALDAATSFATWDQLRREQGLGASATTRIVTRLVRGVLGGHDT
jgi:AcrR family transcriptional regulator